jgi:hypothetical protein
VSDPKHDSALINSEPIVFIVSPTHSVRERYAFRNFRGVQRFYREFHVSFRAPQTSIDQHEAKGVISINTAS